MTSKNDCKINIYINSTIPNESRIAITYDNQLAFIDFEKSSQELHKRGNIYLGTVSKIEPSINALFIDYGANRKGFLPFKEVASAYLKTEKKKEETKKPATKSKKPPKKPLKKHPAYLNKSKGQSK